jgi:HSP20 family protein
MAIAVRSTTWSPFSAVFRQFDADFDALVRRSLVPARRAGVGPFFPAADVTKDGNDVVVTIELPGVDVAKDVDVEVADGRLVIAGRRGAQTESTQDGVLRREIRSGHFRREFALPDGVTAQHVTADYDRGLLQVRVRDVVPAPVAPAKVAVTVAGTPAQVEAPVAE